MSLMYTKTALRTKEAQASILVGLFTWYRTGNFAQGWNTMIRYGKQNGAYETVQLGAVFDLIKAIDNYFK